MKFLLLTSFIALVSCSSGPQKNHIDLEETPTVTEADFKKEKPLKVAEIQDFYVGDAKALSPALQDETVDRFSKQEVAQFSDGTDPLLQITVLCNERSFEEGFKKATSIFQRYQKIATYWNAIANCHLNKGDFRKALLFYNKALEIKPNYIPTLNNIGVMYVRQGQHQKALVAFERAYNQSKFSKTPRYNLGKLYLTYGLVELAMPILNGLLSGSQEDVDLLNAVAAAYFLKSEYQEALSVYERIPKEQWENAEIGLNVAFTLQRLNRQEEAKKVFLAVSSPSNSELKRYYTSVGKILGDNE